MKLTNVPKTINGSTVVGFTSTQRFKQLGWQDMSTLSSWYQEDPKKRQFGLIEMFSGATDYRMPSYKKYFETNAVYEVIGMNGVFHYDYPITKPTGTYTAGDTSDYSEAPGIEGTPFPIELDSIFQPGDVLTYDVEYGENIVVSEDYDVKQEGDRYIHMVKYVTQDKFSYFPPDKLKAGIEYFKIGHILGEYSEQFSAPTSMDDNVGTLTCEFTLGNHRGVESYYTMYADMKTFNGASVQTKNNLDRYIRQAEVLGTDKNGNPINAFYVGKINQTTKKIDKRTVRVGSMIEFFVIAELMKLENYQINFQKGGVINDINGTKRLNEGVLPQVKRGYRIFYSRPGGLTRADIRKAAAYVFRGRKGLTPSERELTFDCGYMAYNNVMNIFREEVLQQLNGIQALLGADRVLPKSPVSGKDLTSLKLDPIMFTQVYLPGIGNVKINHDPSMDFQPMTDRHEAGFYGDGYSRNSYTMMIKNAASSEYSNARTNLPRGVKLYENGDKYADMYYVKPEGENFWWGRRDGRYHETAKDIKASLKKMGTEIFAHSVSAGFVPDPSQFVTIELRK